MQKACVCENVNEIRAIIGAYLEELMSDMQEVKITILSSVSTGVLRGYE